jgi:hypothetical protein
MRFPMCVWLAVVLALVSGCRSKKQVETRQTVEEAPAAAPAAPAGPTAIAMGEPGAAAQLAGGFHEIENQAWRWTERQFSVTLGVPAGAATAGAILQMRVTVPQVSVDQLGSLTLTGSVNGTDLAAQTWSQAGDSLYRSEIPATLLRTNPVKIDFRLDKAIPPGPKDRRELGIIVSSIGLERK